MLRTVMAMIALCAAMVLRPGDCRADTIVLVDGRTLHGEIIEESRDTVRFRVIQGGIRAEMEFPRSSVRSLERSPLPSTEDDRNGPTRPAGSSAAQPAPTPPIPGPSERTYFVTIPIEGRLGCEAHWQDIEETLRWAARNPELTHVVLAIDSEGGPIEEARQIAIVLGSFDDRFTYVAMIRKAINGAIVPAVCADVRVILDPGAPGIAVCGFPGAPTAVSATNADWASEVTALGSRKGLDAGLLRALTGGEMQADIAVNRGFAAGIVTDADGLSGLLQLPPLVEPQRVGHATRDRALKREAAVVAKWVADVESTMTALRAGGIKLEGLSGMATAARRAHPDRYIYSYRNGRLTGESAQRWAHQTDVAIELWSRLINTHDSITQVARKARDLNEINIGTFRACNQATLISERESLASELEALLPAISDAESLYQEAKSTVHELRKSRNQDFD